MLDFDEHSGLFTFLGGMIVIVMVAVGISLVMDKKFKASSGIGEVRQEARQQEEEIKELTMRHDHLDMQMVRTVTAIKGSKNEMAELDRKLASLDEREKVLLEKKAVLQGAVSKVDAEFSQYRADYRTRTWSKAAGEKLGDITTRGGRQYKDTQITKVTDAGLEIRHEHGYARVQAPELSTALQDRFQWNDEERRRLLKEEYERIHGKPKPVPAEQPPAAAGAEDGAPVRPATSLQKEVDAAKAARLEKREQIQSARSKVKAWKTKVSKLASERSTAISNSYGNSGSVPGSLETWKAKSERLSRELAKARNELDIARSKLSVLAPDDPELALDFQ
ncbi:MAG: hypothetical protein EOP88_10505 [Verrucomicrobiaceae bacterium]|nr:MAG: hypothetical protein EOP88_10505 [Verrucomicrobiaceae bacterium]